MTTQKSVTIGEAYVQYTDQSMGQIDSLYKHQLETINSNRNVIVLDAPTGSGKTLAALARVLTKRSDAIFIYPTNSLVKNQVSAIADLLVRLGHKPDVTGTPEDKVDSGFDVEETDIDLIHLTGESLEVLSEGGSKGSKIDEILTRTHSADRLRILLTNPDTIYLAFTGRFYRHGRINEQLQTFKTIVLDEFHLYSGPTLARIFFMLNEVRGPCESPFVELLFLSATHGDTLELLRGTYLDLEVIRAEPLAESARDRKRIRHTVVCHIHTLNSVMFGEEHVELAATDILSLYDREHSWKKKAPNVKVLGIFSSVAFAVRVARRVMELVAERGMNPEDVVYQLHGLVPRQARSSLKDMKNAILVGTSAIEVGIDFDVPFLVMEAHDIGSFLQRFGRGGRRQECTAVLYVPQPLADRLRTKGSWIFPEFVEQAHLALNELPSYADFLCSKQARTILLGMALAASRRTFARGRRQEEFNYNEATSFFFHVVKMNSTVKFGDRSLVELIGSMDSEHVKCDLGSFRVKVLARYGFLRGTMNTILVLYPGHLIGSQKPSVYSEMDIFDIFRLGGHLESLERHWRLLPPRLKKRHSKTDILFVIENFEGSGYPVASVAPGAQRQRKASVYVEPHVHVKFKHPRMTEVGRKLLHKRNLVFHWRGMDRYTDYRIPRLFIEGERGGLVIGDWALIAEYLSLKQKEVDSRL